MSWNIWIRAWNLPAQLNDIVQGSVWLTCTQRYDSADHMARTTRLSSSGVDERIELDGNGKGKGKLPLMRFRRAIAFMMQVHSQ
jgi:hypothetical protein